MNRGLYWIMTVLLLAFVAGCGVWDTVTGEDDDYVKLKGETGATCSLDSECRSNSCVYPGICQ